VTACEITGLAVYYNAALLRSFKYQGKLIEIVVFVLNNRICMQKAHTQSNRILKKYYISAY